MVQVALGLGSNLGSRYALLRAAVRLLESQPGCRVLARSALYETPPLGPPQPNYLNAALRVEWVGSVPALWVVTRHVEELLGRIRSQRWGPRTVDIDLLWSSDGPLRTRELELPHGELTRRDFVLAPLLDVWPELRPLLETQLVQQGGAPPVARPGWLDPTGSERRWIGPWLSELPELVCLAVAQRASVATAARAALPFRLRGDRDPEQLISDLVQTLRGTAHSGFAVADAVVLRTTPGALFGLLLGTHLGKCHTEELGKLSLERGTTGLFRLRSER